MARVECLSAEHEHFQCQKLQKRSDKKCRFVFARLSAEFQSEAIVSVRIIIFGNSLPLGVAAQRQKEKQ